MGSRQSKKLAHSFLQADENMGCQAASTNQTFKVCMLLWGPLRSPYFLLSSEPEANSIQLHISLSRLLTRSP